MVSSTRRTAGCGPACPVVWQGRVGDHSPYADCAGMFDSFIPVERKFLGFSFSNQQGTETAHGAKGLVALQAENSGTDATDARDQLGTGDKGTRSLLTRLEELLRILSDTLVAERSG